jgi:hypothetical protein
MQGTGSITYNHREFWQTGWNAGGLDSSILRDCDFIEFDNGKVIPAHATSTYGPSRVQFGPHRQMTDVQAARVEALTMDPRWPGELADVDRDGVARVRCSAGHYAPIVYRVWANGHSARRRGASAWRRAGGSAGADPALPHGGGGAGRS